MVNIFQKMPFILMIVIISIIFLEPIIPYQAKQILYATSLSIKSIIIFLLPIIIFALLFKAIFNLSSNATGIIVLIIICVCVSNFIATFLSHYVGIMIYHFDLSIPLPQKVTGLSASFYLKLPHLINNDTIMLIAIILGIINAKFKTNIAYSIITILDKVMSIILRFLTYVIPIFVIGFIVKLQVDGVINLILRNYAQIFIVTICAQCLYLSIVYMIINNFNISKTINSIKRILPAAIIGFSTMSSAASMSLTIIGAENNATNKDLARSIIPITVNIHLVGDCFAIPILAYSILKIYNIAEPNIITYCIFALYFILAKFSVAAVPGGGIIVMLPILESYLGFNADMLSLITALYILFDPIITSVNILGNGAFAKMIDNIYSSHYNHKQQ